MLTSCKRNINLIFLLALLLCFFSTHSIALEKKQKTVKKVKPQKIEQTINDANLQSSIKKAEELLKKGEIQASLNLFLKIHDYTGSVLKTISILKAHYEEIVKDPKVAQNDKEYIMVRLNRIDKLIPTYKKAKETAAYNIGYIYTKTGETEKARGYLTEVLESTPFDLKKDSLWMRTKSLLLEAYNLEGEF